MTRAEMNSLILSWLDDVSAGYFTPAQTNVWINQAQRQVQQELIMAGQNWYMLPVETITIVGQQDYLYPSDFLKLHRLECVISGTGTNENRQALGQMTTNQQDLVSLASGQPTNFYLKKDRFTISPTPSVAQTMRLYYSYLVADLTSDSSVPDVPSEFQEYVAILAAFDGFIKDDRAPDNLIAKKATYEKRLTDMKTQRAQDMSRQVVMVNDYDSGSWF